MRERRKRRAYTFWIRRGAGVCGWSIRGRNRGRVAIYLSDHGLFSSQVILRCRKATQPRGHLCLAFDWGNRGNGINQRFSLFILSYSFIRSLCATLSITYILIGIFFDNNTRMRWGNKQQKRRTRTFFFIKKNFSPPGPSCLVSKHVSELIRWYSGGDCAQTAKRGTYY